MSLISLMKISSNSMVCSFVDPDKIKEWIQICHLIKEMNSLVCLCFKETGLTLQVKHETKRSVLDITIPSSWFFFYDWKETNLCICTDSFFTIFSRYSGEKIISLESEKNYLLIKCFHEKQNKHFSLPLLHPSYTPILVHLDPGVELTLEIEPFYEICKELYTFDDNVRIHHTKDFFQLISYKREKMVVEILPTMTGERVEQTYENTFELFYLLLFLKCSLLYPTVHVQMSNVLCLTVEKEYQLHYYVCSDKS